MSLTHQQFAKVWIKNYCGIVHYPEREMLHILRESLSLYQHAHYPKSVHYMPKTKRPRKVHFVWADTNEVKCEVRETDNTLYSKWAPDVTCNICRHFMYNRGVTRIL